jgi:hypothetical protein
MVVSVMVVTPWADFEYHAPEMREVPKRSTGVHELAPDAAVYAVL